MKRIILDFETKFEQFEELIQEAFNKDFLDFLVSKETYFELKDIERLNLFSKDSALDSNNFICQKKEKLNELIGDNNKSKNVGFYKVLLSKDDEKQIFDVVHTYNPDFVIISAKDWKIIPFENLIAEMHTKDTELIAEVENIKEAELMLRTLEIGVDGVLIKPKNANDIIELKKLIKESFSIKLKKAKIQSIKNIPESDRVCVDTTSLLHPGEGMLIGSTAMGFALVHAEVFETQFVASRPFRVNAGDVSAYILVPDEESEDKSNYRTRYLSELKGGDKVIVVNTEGSARTVSIGRVKIETRPMLRFELVTEKEGHQIPINCICQNAETIRLVNPKGEAVSVVDLKQGDEILVHIGPGATHFGTAIKETIIEK
ncbi:MAG: 3-dehydroquinate synthase II [Candidatus Lokiarchaeota archaeon]|nr:3-dehydroquinate synthase II [Candidatus Lokiarchaeota archaeon]MBD3200182.1 3-dehydroquinate synthase II [Candidatus Lokiarchaeota archaeon]